MFKKNLLLVVVICLLISLTSCGMAGSMGAIDSNYDLESSESYLESIAPILPAIPHEVKLISKQITTTNNKFFLNILYLLIFWIT